MRIIMANKQNNNEAYNNTIRIIIRTTIMEG